MIQVFNEDGEWKVWIGEDRSHGGICIGIGKTKEEALREANHELVSDLAMISHHLECESQSPKSHD